MPSFNSHGLIDDEQKEGRKAEQSRAEQAFFFSVLLFFLCSVLWALSFSVSVDAYEICSVDMCIFYICVIVW